jgi:hypothetical protein
MSQNDNETKKNDKVQKRTLSFYLQKLFSLVKRNSFNRAFAYASTTVNAFVFVYNGNAVSHSNSFNRASTNARFATSARVFIDYSSHLFSPC